MFVAARSGEGVSSIAASFALIAAESARKPVWLLDLDLKRNAAFNAFAVGEFAHAFGGVGPPYSAALKTQPFFSIEPEDAAASAGLGGQGLAVGIGAREATVVGALGAADAGDEEGHVGKLRRLERRW